MRIGVDLAGVLGETHSERRRRVGADWSGVWGGRELTQRGAGQRPGQKWVLAYFEGHRTLLFADI